MSSSGMSPEASSEVAGPATVDLKLEVVTLPVSDVDRAKRFYQGLGWRLDADIVAGDHFRVVQLTPSPLRVLDLVRQGRHHRRAWVRPALAARGRRHRSGA